MKNIEMMTKIIDAIKRVTTDLFEGNIIECKSYIYDCNHKYVGAKAYVFPCKKSDVFGEEAIFAELHYAYTPFKMNGDIDFKIFFGIYDRERRKQIVNLSMENGCIDEYSTAKVDILSDRGIDKFVEDFEHFILNLIISE